MRKIIHRVTTEIKEIILDNDIKTLILTDPDNWPLPPFSAGSHIDVYLPSGKIRQYSLCGDPDISNEYIISVKGEKEGRGGSQEVHELRKGDILPVSLPRNNFPLMPAQNYLFIAGGIGVTPFLSMIPVLERSNSQWELHICASNKNNIPCSCLLKSYMEDERVHWHFSEEGNRISIPQVINEVSLGQQLYCCGPEKMLMEFENLNSEISERVHIEHFGFNKPIDDPAYEIYLKRSDKTILVPRGETMLNALWNADIEVPASCEGGVCLECKTRYLEGVPAHRDLTMKIADRDNYLTPCVSGCSSSRLVLDI